MIRKIAINDYVYMLLDNGAIMNLCIVPGNQLNLTNNIRTVGIDYVEQYKGNFFRTEDAAIKASNKRRQGINQAAKKNNKNNNDKLPIFWIIG